MAADAIASYVLHAAAVADNYLQLTSTVDQRLAALPRWQVALVGALTWVVVSWIYSALFHRVSLTTRIRRAFFRFLRTNNVTSSVIDAKIERELDKLDLPFATTDAQASYHALPATGLKKAAVLALSKARAGEGHYDWRQGRASGAVYAGGEDWGEFMADVMRDYLWSNPLHSDIFPGVRKMESEVVSMTLNMFNGGPDSCGAMTSGGTESILMAMKAYRDRARDRGISEPELVVPSSVHVAFDKAAAYFGILIVRVPVDPITSRADVVAMTAAINSSTIALVGSAPSYPHGVIDPIAALSEVAVLHDIGLHVDSCLGGFLVPFAEAAGFPLPPFDFRLPGVSSISADTHKYGYAVKGTSVVMFSTHALRHYMYFVQSTWSGGIYASPSLQGSRCGAVIAAAWGAMVHLGREGYISATFKILTAARRLEAAIKTIDGLFQYGAADTSVVAWSSNRFNIYSLAGMMSKRGWNLSSMQKPPAVHIALTLRHTADGVLDQLIADLREVSAALLEQGDQPASSGSAALYGMAETIPDASLIASFAHAFLDASYRVDTRCKTHVM